MKRKKSKSKKALVTLSLAVADSPEIKVGTDMAALNDRARTIQARLGTLNAERAKLEAEQHGIDMRREKLRREFDAASNP